MPRERADQRPLRLLVAGGGTGGHVYPALAVAEEVRAADPAATIVFLGTAHGLESRAIPAAGFPLRLITARGLPRRVSVRAVRDLAEIVWGCVQTVGIVWSVRPDVVLGTGGYVSAPLVIAASLSGRPVVVQEQNAIAGIANRALARLAREVHVAFPAAVDALGGASSRVHLSGNPLRRAVLAGDRAQAAARFGLRADRRTVLVFGGSLGARTINRAIIDAAPLLAPLDAQFLVQTGAAMRDAVHDACAAAGLSAHVAAYIDDMGGAYALADLIVCRAGAMTLAEVTACGRPSVLVPYPFAAHGHQDANAAWLSGQGASEVIPDAECTGPRVAETVRRLLDDPARLAAMGRAARGAARPDAARDIARALYRAAGRAAPDALAAGAAR